MDFVRVSVHIQTHTNSTLLDFFIIHLDVGSLCYLVIITPPPILPG